MEKYYLAIDIGASSGRHMLASIAGDKMQLEEIYRFPNGMEHVDGTLCWNVGRLFNEIKNGLKKCKALGKVPAFMGIDTWAVDYVLLDQKEQILGHTVGYRDSRTNGMDERIYEKISPEALYKRTGIQKQIFNTIYQLTAVRQSHPEELEAAESMLMIPDYFGFLLTGVKKMEYTNATSTQLINPVTMLMYGKEASNRKQEIDRQHHTIPNQRNQRPKDKHRGNVYNLLFRHGKVRSQNMEKLKGSFPTFCKQTFPQFHKIASYAHYAQCRLQLNPSHSYHFT